MLHLLNFGVHLKISGGCMEDVFIHKHFYTEGKASI